jgi:Tfp pilus assembly protein PilF
MVSTAERLALAQDQLDLGLKHLHAGAPELAQPVLQAAVALAPDSAATHYHLGVAFARLGDYAAAERACRAAIEVDPAHAVAVHHLGAILVQEGRLDEARQWLIRAADIAPQNVVARRDLAVVCLFLGDLDAARAAFFQAVQLDPTAGQLLPTTVQLFPADRFPAEAKQLIGLLERLAAEADQLSDVQQIDLFYGLGRARDAAGDHEAAFAAFARANAIKRKGLVYSIDDHEAVLRRTAECFDSALLQRLAGAGCLSERPIFIVGMPRSGTTLVEQIIGAHPQVSAGGEILAMLQIVEHSKGPDGLAYPDWAPRLEPADCQKVGETYLSQLPPPRPGEARFTDKRLENVQNLGLISVSLPNAPLIWVRRDARDCAWSCFSTQFLAGQPWSHDLEETGRYWRAQDALMRHWSAALPPGRLLEVPYEALVADLEGWARRIVAHCGLAWDPACLEFHMSRQAVRSASAAQVRQPIYDTSIGRWRAYERHLEPLLRRLDEPPGEAAVRRKRG